MRILGKTSIKQFEDHDLRPTAPLHSEQIISKERVARHGEVYTAIKQVDDMLRLVKNEIQKIESRVLEPACGTGNFLVEVLGRKLRTIEGKYSDDRLMFERFSITALSSIYGIDILADNIHKCRRRLFETFSNRYLKIFGDLSSISCRNSIKNILDANIIWGDAVGLTAGGKSSRPIVITEWKIIDHTKMVAINHSLKSLLENKGSDITDKKTPSRSRSQAPLLDLLFSSHAKVA